MVRCDERNLVRAVLGLRIEGRWWSRWRTKSIWEQMVRMKIVACGIDVTLVEDRKTWKAANRQPDPATDGPKCLSWVVPALKSSAVFDLIITLALIFCMIQRPTRSRYKHFFLVSPTWHFLFDCTTSELLPTFFYHLETTSRSYESIFVSSTWQNKIDGFFLMPFSELEMLLLREI